MPKAHQQQQKQRRSRGRGPKQDEFDHVVVEIARVTRVMAGGKRMRFRASVAVGDKKGRVSVGVAKAGDVSQAVQKAVTQAKKHFITVPMINDTIPHEIRVKHKSAYVMLKPAPKGTGIIAGGPIRSVLEVAGVRNVVAKMLGAQNKLSNMTATVLALKSLKQPRTT